MRAPGESIVVCLLAASYGGNASFEQKVLCQIGDALFGEHQVGFHTNDVIALFAHCFFLLLQNLGHVRLVHYLQRRLQTITSIDALAVHQRPTWVAGGWCGSIGSKSVCYSRTALAVLIPALRLTTSLELSRVRVFSSLDPGFGSKVRVQNSRQLYTSRRVLWARYAMLPATCPALMVPLAAATTQNQRVGVYLSVYLSAKVYNKEKSTCVLDFRPSCTRGCSREAPRAVSLSSAASWRASRLC